jgi:hypothetical protein
MDERQTEAIARSLLEPELKSQEVRQQKLRDRQRRLAFSSVPLAARQRSVSFALFGIAAGSALGYFGAAYLTRGFITWVIAVCVVAGLAISVLPNHSSSGRAKTRAA